MLSLCLLLSYPLFNYFQDHVLCVVGASMTPTMEDGGYYFSAWEKEAPERGDIVVVEVDVKDGGIRWWLKRVIGLAGDTIQVKAGAAHILLNGEPLDEPYLDPALVTYVEGGTWTVLDGEMFVMGDNRGNSTDSRYVGPLKLERVEFTFGTYFQFW